MESAPVPFTQNGLDRAAEKRGDAAWLADQRFGDDARFCVFWRGRPLVTPEGETILWLSRQDAEALTGVEAPWVLLGLDEQNKACIAMEAAPDREDPADGASGARFRDLRAIGARVSAEEAGIMAQAKSLLGWHGRHGFCANCGAKTRMMEGGYKRHCTACGADHFPRVDPVALVLVIHDGKCLLARGPEWPEGLYSALAGFVEPGETVEQAAIREVYEETGVSIADVRIVVNQPWPWASSLMIGCSAKATTQAISVDGVEIGAARWFTVEDCEAMLVGQAVDGAWAPPNVALAHHLIRMWLEEEGMAHARA